MMSAIYDKSIVPVRAPETRRSDRADESVLGSIVIIDDRSLERECLREIISNSYTHASCHAFNSIDAWRRARISDDQVIVFNLNHRSIFDDDALAQVRSLVADAGQSPVITISQVDEPTAILASLDAGTAGHIPSSASMADVIEAVRVVSSGGMFLPRANIMSVLRSVVSEKPARQSDGLEELFTARQLEVARALQRGAANKTIAYELNLCESTVKVHIRNIMRKLGVTNRTQAAYRLTEHIHQHDGPRI
ncbi:LuxR C-terminal-related transcriptional regulator [Pseudooceanicola sp. LIPI14-2-Ac024]|uniref:LuxR C-terminal-related transcriptional regulator n=1 Tax=Pseudooceanicola sp. LIPI14-2-Ac024 TaxID=3344875 RepID=UPI0035CF228E